MVQKTLTVFECDVCGAEGTRYTMIFPDGHFVMDRCEKHNTKQERMRDEKGSWAAKSSGARSTFKVSSLSDIERQRRVE